MARYTSPDYRCIVTGRMGADLHHVKSRKSGGTDEDFNMIPIAHGIHQEWHQKGSVFMAEKYPRIREWLLEQGWYICPVRKKWAHD